MDPTTLLEHREFVKAVAGALLRNDADVEDAVQETYVAALQAAPPRSGRVRPWLGGITRNVAKRIHRTRSRTRRREEAVARPDRAAAESTEKLRWQQRVVEEVLALDAIYRDVLLLRYYEELPPREIARKLDVPVNTVRTRFRRGLEKLRERFDKRYGRTAWSAGLAALFGTHAAAAGGGKLVTAALVVLVAGTAFVGYHATRGDGARSGRSGALARNETAADGSSEGGVTEADDGVAAALHPTRFLGRVFDYDAKPPVPLANAVVHLSRTRLREQPTWDPVAQARTDEAGRFEFAWRKDWSVAHDAEGKLNSFHLYVQKEGRWADPVYVLARGFEQGHDFSVRLLPRPRIRLADGEELRGIPGLTVSFFAVDDLRMPPGRAFWSGRSAADGTIEVDWPSYLSRALIRVELPAGDILQWRIDLAEVRSSDPYIVPVDRDSIATVSLKVVGIDGKPVGAGTQVVVEGTWAPDGDGDAEDTFGLIRGAQDRPLVGRTGAGGTVTFRFPADRPLGGRYVPYRMIAFDETPRYVEWVAEEATLAESTPNGFSLPTLRFGTAHPWANRFFVEGVGAEDEVSIHGVDAEGAPRSWDCGIEFFVGNAALVQYVRSDADAFSSGEPAPALDDHPVAVVVRSERGFRWHTMPGSELGHQLIEGGCLRLDQSAGAREIRLRPEVDADLLLVAKGTPFAFQVPLAAGHPESFAIPDVPGPWRARFANKSIAFDPAKRDELVLE